MTVQLPTWQPYGALIDRLMPNIEHAMIASADGEILWASDAEAGAMLRSTLGILASSTGSRPGELDGLLDVLIAPMARYGFRIRGALGEVLGLVLLATKPETRTVADLASVHALLKPALDSLQGEFVARAESGEINGSFAVDERHLGIIQRLAADPVGVDRVALDLIPKLILEHVPGAIALVATTLPSRAEVQTQSAGEPDFDPELFALVKTHLATRCRLHGRTLVANRLQLEASESPLPYKALATPIRDALRRVTGVVAVIRAESGEDFRLRDAQVLELLARQATRIAGRRFDTATGLFTQEALIAEAARAAAAAQADEAHAGPRSEGILYVDVDQLSVVNERYGMPAGDELIRDVAAMLQRRSGVSGLAARLGGDRFAVMIPGLNPEALEHLAEEIRAEAEVLRQATRNDRPPSASVSVGVAPLLPNDPALQHALAAAECACRAAKERGGNRAEVFQGRAKESRGNGSRVGEAGAHEARAPGGRSGAGRVADCGPRARGSPTNRGTAYLSAQIEAALVGDGLELWAQPMLPLGAVPGDARFDLSVRVRDKDGECRSTAKLFGALDADLSRRLDRWVLERSFARLVEARAALAEHPARFCIHLSAAAVADAEFWRRLEDLVYETRLDAGSVGIACTEAALETRGEQLGPSMARLRDRGVSFALDQFGLRTGWPLNIGALPVSGVRLHGSLARNVLDDPLGRSRIVAIAHLAQAFGLETVATAIESDAIRAAMAPLGVDFGQGFAIGKATSLDAAIADLSLYSCFATSTGLFDTITPKTLTVRR
jgi:diguanylate cyclase (GGDEF)-like protein